jgi:hypothetical protein
MKRRGKKVRNTEFGDSGRGEGFERVRKAGETPALRRSRSPRGFTAQIEKENDYENGNEPAWRTRAIRHNEV